MDLVKDYLHAVSSTVCDICGVDAEKIQLVNGQRFNEGNYCYGSIEIKDSKFKIRVVKDAQYRTWLEKQCRRNLLKRFAFVWIEITPGVDPGYVNVEWRMKP